MRVTDTDQANASPLLSRPAVEAWILALLLAFAAFFLARTHTTTRIDATAYDAMLNTVHMDTRAAPVIVAIDERSIASIGQWPWPRSIYARVLDRLHALGVRRVALDVLFAEPDLRDPASDAALSVALKRNGPVVLPMVIDAQRAGGQLLEVLPAPIFLSAGTRVGHVHHDPDDDGVARGLYLWQGIDSAHWPHLALALSGGEAATPSTADAPSEQNVRAEYRLLPFAGPAGTMPTVSLLDVLENRVPVASLRNKTVLIGMTAAAGADNVATPMTVLGRPMSGVEFNANAYLAIVNRALLQPLSTAATATLSALLAILPMLLLPRLAPRQSLLTTLGIATMPSAFSLLLLQQAQLWFPPVAATFVILASYPLWAWRRLEQTLRTLRGEIRRIQLDAERTPLHRDDPDLETDLRFLETVLPVKRNTDSPDLPALPAFPRNDSLAAQRWALQGTHAVFQVHGSNGPARLVLDILRPLSAAESGLLNAFADRLETSESPLVTSQEVLSQGLNRLQSAIGAQRGLLDIARFGLMGMRDGVLLLGHLGRPLFANDAARAMLGVDIRPKLHAGEILGALRGQTADAWRKHLRELFTEGTDSMLEAIAADGRELLVHLSPSGAAAHTTDAVTATVGAFGPHAAVITLVDISAIRRAERTHRETLGFLSHDLRSPIVSLLALIRSAAERTPDAEATALYSRMERYASRSLDNAEQFLQLTRIENEPDMQVYELDLGAVAENAIGQLVDQARAKHMRIDFKCAVDDGVWVLGNGEYLERAIVNLLSNAIKYAPGNTSIEISVATENEAAICTVSDHGKGIDPADLPNLFRAYYQGAAQRGRGDGIGLGLRFVTVVCERHAGSISADATPGGGATFILRIPLHEG